MKYHHELNILLIPKVDSYGLMEFIFGGIYIF